MSDGNRTAAGWANNAAEAAIVYFQQIHESIFISVRHEDAKQLKGDETVLVNQRGVTMDVFCCTYIHADQMKFSRAGENSIFTVIIAHFSVKRPRRGRADRYREAMRNEKLLQEAATWREKLTPAIK